MRAILVTKPGKNYMVLQSLIALSRVLFLKYFNGFFNNTFKNYCLYICIHSTRFTVGRSTDLALAKAIVLLEEAVEGKKYGFAVSLDYSGVFDTLSFTSGLTGLQDLPIFF
ncbi:unnamed protein product [Lepeophtheirus salmonis]|uniref:(salmon louse) hypothetical protein n=1 Tax=Lepeophtheirus salmonis TaxID=72036 RepID=A0A7R8CKZ2_LEPSM|nr:unnamed protein product [Lepeophtheirus salmonis]CAF2852775.1 unnamed protein product [Lepeophtheirus salmonis]